MNKLADFWHTHLDTDRQIAWPAGQAERDVLGRNLFGLGFVDALDFNLKRADDLLDNPHTTIDDTLRGGPKQRSEEEAYRDCFASLSSEQRNLVRKLIRKLVLGALFQVLVGVDQIHRGEFEITLFDRRKDGTEFRAQVFPVNEKRTLELHDELFQWVWNYSQYAQDLVTKTDDPRGWTTFQFTI